MITYILKKFYYKLPGNLKMIAINIFYFLKLSKIYKRYSSPDYFPINYVDSLNSPIFGNSASEGFFYRFYQEKLVLHHLSPDDFMKYKYEIIYGKYYRNEKLTFKCQENSVLPFSLESNGNVLKISSNNKVREEIKNLPINRFHYFLAKKNTQYSIKANKDIIIGKPLQLRQTKKHKKKLVLCIFIDGLVDSSELLNYSNENLMPNTADFFKNATRFRNHYSNAEWTLPSVPSFFTGTRPQKHCFFDPKENHVIGENSKIISEFFQEDGYLTFQACGNWRKSPAYGYIKGFDRTIYKKELTANEIIFSFLDHMRAFKDRDHFVWLSFMEVHHLLNVIPDVSNQMDNNICVTPWYDPENKNKSVFISKDNKLIDIYINEIKRLDFYLKIIYDYVKENFMNDEIVISLVSDHGQAFMSEDNNPLSRARTKVPWYFFSKGVPNQDSYELTENIDIFETILKYSNLQPSKNDYDSRTPFVLGGKDKRKYVLSQSIYPGQTYKAVIRDQNYEYRYETNSVVSSNGLIQGKIDLKSYFLINDGKKEEKKCYKKAVIEKVNEWNQKNLQ